MESNEQREPVVLHNLPQLPEAQIRSLIEKALPEASLSAQDVLVRRKEDRLQAFLMVPSDKVEQICAKKELNVAGEKVFVRRWFCDYQVFIGRLPEGLSLEETIAAISARFGKITRYEEVQPHQGSKNRFRHLYLQFQRAEDAERCLFSQQRVEVKNHELRVARSYAFGQNEETDKKLFIKVISEPENSQELQTAITEYFCREGQLRERVHLENGKGTVTFTSAEVADRVLKQFKGNRIEKWDVILRPFANYKDNFTAFMANVTPTLNQIQLQQILHEYQPIISCKLQRSNNSTTVNAVVTFGQKDSFNRLLAEYKTIDSLRPAFVGSPYITRHMSAKERNEYHKFRKGDNNKRAPTQQERGFRPIGIPHNEGFMMQPPQFGYGFNPQMGVPMNVPMSIPAFRK